MIPAAHSEAELRKLLRGDADTQDRVLVVDSICWRPHLETSMEIALIAREAGHEVHYLNLRPVLPFVEDQTWFPRALDVRAARRRRGVALLNDLGIPSMNPAIEPAQTAAAWQRADRLLDGCSNQDAVRKLAIEGFPDLGWAVLSSVVSKTQKPAATPVSDARLYRSVLAAALLAFDAASRAIEQLKPSVVVLFNGRFATTRAVLRAATHAGTRALVHERGRDRNHFWVATEPIHDPDYLQRCVRAFWSPEREDDGHRFFQERRDRVERNWFSFTRMQEHGKLPSDFDQDVRWVVFFTTSEDEFVAIGSKFINPYFPTQLDAIRAVHAAVKATPGHRLCIRVHPHIAMKAPEQRRFWKEFAIPGVVVIAPDADIDTYALVDRAAVVCSYGSTVGAEATYWGRPSLLLSRSMYDGLDIATRAKDEGSIRKFLEQPIVHAQHAALVYGAFFAGYGLPFRHFAADDLFRGSFHGVVLDDTPLVKLWRTLRTAVRRLFRGRGARK